MIEFAWPWSFLLLPLPWLAWRYLSAVADPRHGALRIPFYSRWVGREGHNSDHRPSSLLGWLAILAWLLLLIAAARPQGLDEPRQWADTGRDLMLAVDVSGSMEIADFLLQGQRIDRLGAVKAVAGAFIERRHGDRLGLILFGSHAYVQAPLSFDRASVRYLLERADIGLAGKETAIGEAIGLATERLRNSPRQHRVLILLTDGADTTGHIDPLAAARLARRHGVRIYTIGVGADEQTRQSLFGNRLNTSTGELDETTLRRIAEITEGRYFRAADTRALEAIYRQLDALQPLPTERPPLQPVREWFHWPLTIALLLYGYLAWRLASSPRETT